MLIMLQQQSSGQPSGAVPSEGAGTLAACKALFAQLPWEKMQQLPEDIIRTQVLPQLIAFLHSLAPQAAAGISDAADLMQKAITVRCFVFSSLAL